MLQVIIPGVVMFLVFFCLNLFFGFVKDKEGKKSVVLSLVFALIAAIVGSAASWRLQRCFNRDN
jgi:uncharacterized membrane protein